MLFYISAEKSPNLRANLIFCHGIFVLDPDPDLYLSIRIRIRLLLYKSGFASLVSRTSRSQNGTRCRPLVALKGAITFNSL